MTTVPLFLLLSSSLSHSLVHCRGLSLSHVWSLPVASHLFRRRNLWKYHQVSHSPLFSPPSALALTPLLQLHFPDERGGSWEQRIAHGHPRRLGRVHPLHLVSLSSSHLVSSPSPCSCSCSFCYCCRGKVPPESRCHRNCQLLSVLFAITVTVAPSFSLSTSSLLTYPLTCCLLSAL
jgi:hypothetical protein